jgi:hypothetical protein
MAWLCLHVTVLAGTTVVLFKSGASQADIICACAHGADHGPCPMHRKPADSTRCRLQNTQHDLAFLSMLGPVTLPVPTATVVADVAPTAAFEYYTPVICERTVPPDPPPPRV